MKQVVSISLGAAARNYQFRTQIFGQELQVQRIGTDGNLAQAKAFVQESDGLAVAIGLGDATSLTKNDFSQLAAMARQTPVVDGSLLHKTFGRWAVKRAADKLKGLFNQRRILVLKGLEAYQMTQVLATYEPELRFADPLFATKLAFTPALQSLKQLELYAQLGAKFANLNLNLSKLILPKLKLPQQPALTSAAFAELFAWAEIVVGDFATLQAIAPQDLPGLTIFTDAPSRAEIEDLGKRGVVRLITTSPSLSAEHPFVAMDVLEALVVALQEKPGPLAEATVLDFISAAQWEPTIQELNPAPKKPSFAFVVHPLVPRHIYSNPRFSFTRHFPAVLVEKAAAYLPPFYLSRIRGIRSKATGAEMEGILISLGATPGEMLRRPPEFTYRQLVEAAKMAEKMGAKIMGLGAFTSVVGDAGITVAKQSAIGITSGNSLTVAATLEAAKQAVRLMGGRVDKGRAMVVGATGSIGAVCARLLALAIKDVILIAPRPERLLALKQQIEKETPGAQVLAATDPNPYIGEADLIVTTTSALTGGIINLALLKPGAVVCDVARPPNVHKEEAAGRPDILVIDSGEIRLPGEPDFGVDIDLPPGVAYACLAETALLAMEGKFGDYTLGRTIEMERVKEMYRLMQKHGLELAGLRSFGQYLSEAEIAEKRRLADERRS